MLNERGGFETDSTITRIAFDQYLIVTSTAQTVRDAYWIKRNIPRLKIWKSGREEKKTEKTQKTQKTQKDTREEIILKTTHSFLFLFSDAISTLTDVTSAFACIVLMGPKVKSLFV